MRNPLPPLPVQVLEETGKLHAMGRAASADEVAAPIVFLASDAASFITGVNLCIDGGATLGYWWAPPRMHAHCLHSVGVRLDVNGGAAWIHCDAMCACMHYWGVRAHEAAKNMCVDARYGTAAYKM